LAELNTPAKNIYIYPKTHVYMPPNQTPPGQNVKIRRVRNATRGLVAFGAAAAVLVLVLLLAASQSAAGADAGGAYQYAKSHVTLYG
jgi:hypothetical protein